MTYSKEYIDRAEEVILHTYNRFQIVLDKGNGVHLYDVDGKEYLDFAAGIAVFALGYNNQAYNQALKDQIDKVIHTSNLYYNVPMMEAISPHPAIASGKSTPETAATVVPRVSADTRDPT